MQQLAADVAASWSITFRARCALLCSTTAGPLAPSETIFLSSKASKVTGVTLPSSRYIEQMQSILSCAFMFKKESEIETTAAPTIDIARQLKLSDFIIGSVRQSSMRLARVGK